jgi:hypothetical protein
MADQPSSPERQDRADRGPTAGPPRWVKISAIITLALVALILLLAGGNHGPGRPTSHPADTAASCRPQPPQRTTGVSPWP